MIRIRRQRPKNAPTVCYGAAEHDTEGCSVECTSTRSRNCFTPVVLWREREKDSLPLSQSIPSASPQLLSFHPDATRRHPQRAYHVPLMPNRLTSRMIILLPSRALTPSCAIRAALVAIFFVPIPKPKRFSLAAFPVSHVFKRNLRGEELYWSVS